MKVGDLCILPAFERFYRDENELLEEPSYRRIFHHPTDQICIVLESMRFVSVCMHRTERPKKQNKVYVISDFNGRVPPRYIEEPEFESSIERHPFYLVTLLNEKVLVAHNVLRKM